LVRLAPLLALFAASCSYGASFDDCRVSACHGPEDCPGGFTCDGDGFCRSPGATISCSVVLDGGVDGKPGGDGAPARCNGAATTCPTFANMNACVAQFGCGWAATTCTVTTNCAQYMTNQQCTAHAECVTDFSTSTCVKKAGYCNGASKPQCEATANCAFGGGCGGTADACDAFQNMSTCAAQGGCSWH
jgi:hypothetical protein